MKKEKVPKIYKETPEARKERVQSEGNAFSPKVEKLKTTYNRKTAKKETQKMIRDDER